MKGASALAAALVLAVGAWGVTSVVGWSGDEVLGQDGEPIICPDGSTLRADLGADAPEPKHQEFRKVLRGLPGDKTAVLNDYTGEFEVVDAVRVKVREGATAVTMPGEPFVYACDANNEPTLAPLSAVDPQAGAAARKQSRRTIRRILRQGGDDLTGLGSTMPAGRD